MKLVFGLIPLLSLWNPAAVVTANEDVDCYNSTEVIATMERDLHISTLANGGTIDDIEMPRTYILCPDTLFQIGQPADGGKSFVGGEAPLATTLPGMHVKCGADGSRSNNCTFRGGYTQYAGPSDMLLTRLGLGQLIPANNDNLLLEGITFVEATGTSVNLRTLGENIVVKDCAFYDHTAIGSCPSVLDAANEVSVLVDSCEFADNLVSSRVIGAFDNATIVVKDTVFRNNTVLNSDEDAGKVIWFGLRLTSSDGMTPNLSGSVEGNCFIDNVVNNTILIYDDVAEVELANNYAASAVQTDGVICSDVAMAAGNTGRALEFTCDDFDAPTCALLTDAAEPEEEMEGDEPKEEDMEGGESSADAPTEDTDTEPESLASGGARAFAVLESVAMVGAISALLA